MPRTGAEVMVLKGHTGRVTSAGWSPDGTRIVTASSDMTVRTWDDRTGAELLALKGHTARVNSAAWSPDGSKVVSGGCDRLALIYDATPIDRQFLPPPPAIAPPPREARR